MLGTNHEHGEAAGDETSSPSPLDLALRYIRRGWNPVPIPFKAKGPTDNGWQERVITAENAPQFFNGQAQKIGVILGPTSGGLTDVDLDCPEGIAVAPDLLPETHAVFGRPSKPRSHYLYKTSLARTADKATLQFAIRRTKPRWWSCASEGRAARRPYSRDRRTQAAKS